MIPADYRDLVNPLIQLVKKTGNTILDIYHQSNPLQIELKDDNTPLTQADKDAHNILVEGLTKLTPTWPVLSEESADIPFTKRKQWDFYWLVDPLDGTKEFINHTGEFSVNVALIHQHKPVVGIVYFPAFHVYYYASQNGGSFKQIGDSAEIEIRIRKRPRIPHLLVSRRHNNAKLEAFLKLIGNYKLTTAGSSLKLCLIAEGKADLYPRLSPTSEWDTAGGQCIIEQAGGSLIDLSGAPLSYNTKSSLLNPDFIAIGDQTYNWLQYFMRSGDLCN